MSDPIRSRNRAAIVFVISLAVFVPALVIPRGADDPSTRKLILFASLPVMLFSAIWLAVRWDEARRLIRLRAGQGIVARWTIDPSRWQEFRRHSAEWDKRQDIQPNDADLAQDPGTDGIEIVVTRDAILIGKDYTPVERDVRITVRSNWMEFYQVIPKASGTALRTVLRLPLQPGKEHLAAEVEQAYKRTLQVAKSGPHQLIYIALICFVGVPAVTALIWFLAWVTGWVE